MLSNMKKVSLKPDHVLMDPDFEGYKLSLESVPIYQTNFDGPIKARTVNDDQFSYLHAKLFGSTNLLIGDKFNPISNVAYLIDPQHETVSQVKDLSADGRPPEVHHVWISPDGDSKFAAHGDYNPSLQFADDDCAFFADGRGSLYILQTGNRTDENQGQWKVTYHEQVCGTNCPFVVSSAAIKRKTESGRTIFCLLQYVQDVDKIETSAKIILSKTSHQYVNVVEWIAFVESAETCATSWKMASLRRYVFNGGLDYLELSPDGSSLYCATDKPYKLVFDSEGIPEEVEAMDKSEPATKKKPKLPTFFWMQGVEDMVVWLILPEGTTKRDLKVTLKPSEIFVKVGNEEKISGKLYDVIDGDSATWTIQKGGKLEITVCKAHEGLVWKRFLKDETVADGEEVMDPVMVDRIHEQFNQITSEQAIDQGASSIYNAQELEDCDEPPESDEHLYVIDGQGGFNVNLSGRQWLFNVQSTIEGWPQRICLRHDVDGLVWQPEMATEFRMHHVGTLCALGYVQASKQLRKFSFAAPDLSFSAICDNSRHIYIYREPAPLAAECELRNRKSGKEVRHVAKQSVVTLEDSSDVIGAHATNHSILLRLKMQFLPFV